MAARGSTTGTLAENRKPRRARSPRLCICRERVRAILAVQCRLALPAGTGARRPQWRLCRGATCGVRGGMPGSQCGGGPPRTSRQTCGRRRTPTEPRSRRAGTPPGAPPPCNTAGSTRGQTHRLKQHKGTAPSTTPAPWPHVLDSAAGPCLCARHHLFVPASGDEAVRSPGLTRTANAMHRVRPQEPGLMLTVAAQPP